MAARRRRDQGRRAKVPRGNAILPRSPAKTGRATVPRMAIALPEATASRPKPRAHRREVSPRLRRCLWSRVRRIEPAPRVPLARLDRRRDRVPPPGRGAGIRRAVGAERIPGAVEVEAVPPVTLGHERHEPPRRIGCPARWCRPGRRSRAPTPLRPPWAVAARRSRTRSPPIGTTTLPASAASTSTPSTPSTRTVARVSGGRRCPTKTSARCCG